MLGVSTSTVADWLEPLSEEWEDTFINPLSDSQHISETRTGVYDLTVSQLQAIRNATGGGEDGERLANETVAHDLTSQEIRDAGDHIEDGLSIEDAAAVVDDTDETTVESLQADTATAEVDEGEHAEEDETEAGAVAPAAADARAGAKAEAETKASDGSGTDGGATTEAAGAGARTEQHSDAGAGETSAESASRSSSSFGSGAGAGRRHRQQATAHEGAQNDSESTDEIMDVHADRKSSERDGGSETGGDAGQQVQEDYETYTGEIPVANERARAQLQEHGRLITFRSGRIPTGPGYWVPEYGGEHAGTVLVGRCEDVDPQADAELGPYLSWSGFDTLQEWREGIGDLPDSGSLYVLTETAIEESDA